MTASRDEAVAARDDAERALAALPPALEIETRLASVRGEIESQRAQLAEVRAEAQALAREAELAARRLAAIAAERRRLERPQRQRGLADRDPGARVEEATTERAGLEDAPARLRREAHALISEIETAETARRAAADRLAAGRERACRSRP